MLNRWIEQKCFTVKGSLNNRVSFDSWWINKGLTSRLNYIKAMTNWAADANNTERLYILYHDITERPKCFCGNDLSFKQFKSGYREYCSIICVTQSEKRNRIISHKVKNNTERHEKAKKTNLERYGHECARKSDIVKKKIKQTKLERYGDENYNNEEKRLATVFERYGVTEAAYIPSRIENNKRTRAEKIPQLRNVEWLKEMNKTHTLTEISETLNVNPTAVGYWFRNLSIKPQYHSRAYYSKGQQELCDFVSKYNTAKLNDRTVIYPKDIDVMIPEKNLAIEYNGCYWHKEDDKRHIEKYNMCKEKSVRLLQFWDYEWNEKKDICKSMLLGAMNIFSESIGARKCSIRPLNNDTYRQFVNDNHIQGYAHASIKVGLYFGERLVHCMGFSKTRFNKDYDYELVRSCSLLNCRVQGAVSKLIKWFRRQYEGSILSYCDLRFFDGNSYLASGFELKYQTQPNYFYWSPKYGVESRQKFQKSKQSQLLQNFDDALTEVENMHNNNWFRVFDCGSKVFVLE